MGLHAESELRVDQDMPHQHKWTAQLVVVCRTQIESHRNELFPLLQRCGVCRVESRVPCRKGNYSPLCAEVVIKTQYSSDKLSYCLVWRTHAAFVLLDEQHLLFSGADRETVELDYCS